MNANHQHELPDERQLFTSDAAAESLRVISELTNAGFIAYLAGGCVRDALLGRSPKDFDVATNATPDSVRELFGKRQTLAFGASFGVIAVLPPKAAQKSDANMVPPTEVATFRSDGEYSDGRRPDSVHFGTAEQDALRRDFTINGMFYDPDAGAVIDFVGGKSDLKAGLLQTIGDPFQRFGEDKLRMLRAVRFATTLRLTIQEATIHAIQTHGDDLAVISGERIGAEMRKILTSPFPADGLQYLKLCCLDAVVLPEISELSVEIVEPYFESLVTRDVPSVLACLLACQRGTTDDIVKISFRWKLSNEEQRQTKSALQHARDLIKADERPWSKIQPLLIHRDISEILNVAQAIARAEELPLAGISLANDAMTWSSEKLNPTPLLTGHDLHQHQFPAGAIFRTILTEVRRAQLDGEISSPEAALQMAREMIDGDL